MKTLKYFMQNPQDVQLIAATLKNLLPEGFARNAPQTIGLVAGTGLDAIASELANSPGSIAIAFGQLPGYPLPECPAGRNAFIYGNLNGCPVLAQSTRFHLYDGFSPAEVCFGTRLMGELGISKLILTNAAGSLNPLFTTPALMLISDMINHTGQSALTGTNHAPWGPRFPDFSSVFDSGLIALCSRIALQLSIPIQKGIYIGVHGPELETPAETRMYRAWGADAIGMSTVLEAAAARHLGMRILGISCLTNQNLPDCMGVTTLEEIIDAAKNCSANLLRLLQSLLPELCVTEMGSEPSGALSNL